MFTIRELYKPSDLSSNDQEPIFLRLLKSKWDYLHEELEVFRYKINKLQERLVDGRYLLQLNPDRGIKRRTPEHIENINQSFDENKFNFAKVSLKEIIFSIGNGDDDKHTLLVNVSPISRYHTLLCPSINKCLPQVVTAESLQLAIDIMFLGMDRDMRIGFNSLCAFASVNHLHYHLLMEKATLPVETVRWTHMKGHLYCLIQYPVPAFCFEVQKLKNSMVNEIFKLLEYFLKESIAHNILITGRRNHSSEKDKDVVSVIIWPRKRTSGVKQFTAFNVAVCELSGWFPIYNEDAYEVLQFEDLENELRKWKIDNFEELCQEVKSLF